MCSAKGESLFNIILAITALAANLNRMHRETSTLWISYNVGEADLAANLLLPTPLLSSQRLKRMKPRLYL
jgi:hypothetical protein